MLGSASRQLLDYTVVDWRKNTIITSNYNDLLKLQPLIHFQVCEANYVTEKWELAKIRASIFTLMRMSE